MQEDWVAGALSELLAAVLALRPELEPWTKIEAAEQVVVDGRAGAILRWSQVTVDQGERRFGLLVTEAELRRLAETNSGFLRLSDLWIMLDEPHPTTARETVTWFRSVEPFMH